MKFIFYLTFLYSALCFSFEVPLNKTSWHSVHYSGVKVNQVSFNSRAMRIYVEQSSSAMIYKFESPRIIDQVHIDAKIEGSLFYRRDLPGSKKADDFPLRIGFILKGNKRLSGLARLIAPSWVKELTELAPHGAGFDKLYSLVFYTKSPNFVTRYHPLAKKYIYENAYEAFDSNGKIQASFTFERPREVLGIWVSADGDDTLSSFTTILSKIEVY